MIGDFILIDESDPPTSIILSPTVPVSCPPCSTTVNLVNFVGLKVSHCSATFSAFDPPMTNQTIMIQAVKTPGSFSRVVKIFFSAFETTFPGSPWDNYTPAHCPVRIRLFVHILLTKLMKFSAKT